MKKQIEIKDKDNLILVNIETENKYFSITGETLQPLENFLKDIDMTKEEADEEMYLIDLTEHNGEEYILTSFGMIHDDILRLRPDLKFLTDIHLSNVETGKPIHAYANGKYHFERNIETGLKYIRATEKQFHEVKKTTEHGNQIFDNLYNLMLPIWQKEAKNAIQFIDEI